MLTNSIKKEALNLSAKEKVELIEILMNNLDKPDQEIEKIWVEESEKRIQAYKSGKIKSIPYSEIKNRYEG
jgi:putative addiction module component (TIGR02574 family)